MKSLALIGKILFGLIMIFFGLQHFLGAESLVGFVPGYLPIKIVFVYFTGLALIGSGIAILIGKQARTAAALLGLMLILFALMIHFGGFMAQNPQSASMFLKDLALGGAAWFISGHVSN